VVTRVCVCVCLSAAACLRYCTDPDVAWESGREYPLVVHYWADLQSGHGLRCYGNITRTRNVSEYMFVLALCLLLFHFVMEPRAEIKIGWATDGGGSGMKFFKNDFLLTCHSDLFGITHLSVLDTVLFTFCVSRQRRKMYCGYARLCVCLCLPVRGRTPTLLHGPGCNLGYW